MRQLSSSKAHWAHASEAGAMTGMRFLLGCYKLGGKPLFKVFLLPVMVYFFLFRRTARAASLAYLQRVQQQGVLPGRSFVYWLSFQHFWQFALSLIDKLAVWMGQIRLNDVRIQGEEIIVQLLAEKRGAVLIMSHLGNFEISRCLSTRHPGFRLTVLMHTKHAQKFNQLFKEQVDDSHIDILQVTDITPATAMILSERVDRGEFIAIAGDRVAVNHPENCLIVDFFGEKAPLPAGPFTLAAILRVPLVSLFCLREANSYGIYFEWLNQGAHVARKQRQQQLQMLAQIYSQQLESHCRRQPLQWFNFFDFWHQPAAPVLDQPETDN